jgi:ABC-2 type transport system ATP-binding protein
MEQRPALLVSNLSKSYAAGFLARGRRPALVDLNLAVQAGEIFGYLGPNGSGKTTTLKVLMGLSFADSGSAMILGHDLADPSWRSHVGFLPEHPYFYDYLSAAEYLDYVGRLFGLDSTLRRERTSRLLERLGLAAVAHVSVRRYSKGMCQRLGIAQALINDPELVFLDEPMSGLDPFGRRLVCDLILELKTKGRTVFFSTHILSDAESLCDRVALLRSGRLLSVGRLDEILQQSVSEVEILLSGGESAAIEALGPGVRQRQRMSERCRLVVDETALAAVLEGALRAGARVLAVQPVRQSLEDFFMKEMSASPPGAWPLQD